MFVLRTGCMGSEHANSYCLTAHDRNEPLNVIESMLVDLLESTDESVVESQHTAKVSSTISTSPNQTA
jgi:hypothetical protein